MNIILIASIAHAINAAYCASLGDLSQPAWDDAPEWQQQSAIAGVKMHLANPEATPEQSHAAWLAQKLADGWTYGPEKNPALKQHPCCLPYDQLPLEQKAKDFLFRATVHALKDITDEGARREADEQIAEMQARIDELSAKNAELQEAIAGNVALSVAISGVQVQYIGARDTYSDRLYGSGLMFTKGQVRNVPGELARRLLNHPDLFARYEDAAPPSDDTVQVLEQAGRERTEKERKQEDLSALHREVDNFADFTSLADFARDRYNLNLVKQRGMLRSRELVHAHIDQFGAA